MKSEPSFERRFRDDLKKLILQLDAADNECAVTDDVTSFEDNLPPEPTLQTLQNLAKTFQDERERVLHEIKPLLRHLPLSDPLLNSISLFGTLDLGLRETAHTRALVWLFNPREKHGFNAVLLKAFLQLIGLRRAAESDLKDVEIHCELSPDQSKDRLDISIRGPSWQVIVEAKINAMEGDEQCARYEQRYPSCSRLIFLTPDGRKPRTAENKRKWVSLSFQKLAAAFQRCSPALRSSPGASYLRLYLTGVLQDICGFRCGPQLRNLQSNQDIYRLRQYLQYYSNTPHQS